MSTYECPGSRMIDRRSDVEESNDRVESVSSELRQWPVQLHLVSPTAPYFRDANLLLTADCVAYAMGGYHPEHLKGNSVAIACPKLDDGQDVYREKLTAMIDEGGINTLNVMIMQVPCCSGLLHLAVEAARAATRSVPIRCEVVGLDGKILKDEWVET